MTHPIPVRMVRSRLRELRSQRGLTQEALGKLAGLSPFTIGRMESGSSSSDRVGTAVRLAVALGVGLGDLYDIDSTAGGCYE